MALARARQPLRVGYGCAARLSVVLESRAPGGNHLKPENYDEETSSA